MLGGQRGGCHHSVVGGALDFSYPCLFLSLPCFCPFYRSVPTWNEVFFRNFSPLVSLQVWKWKHKYIHSVIRYSPSCLDLNVTQVWLIEHPNCLEVDGVVVDIGENVMKWLERFTVSKLYAWLMIHVLPHFSQVTQTEWHYSAAQPQVNKRVQATRERSRVTLRAFAIHSRVLDASHVSAKGANCTACGSEIVCASTKRVRVNLRVRV